VSDKTREFVLETVTKHLRKEDYVFTLQVHGPPWDVYRFKRVGKQGMLALRMIEGAPEIGFFCAGEFTEEEIVRALFEEAPS
jgi:hypothetical protein